MDNRISQLLAVDFPANYSESRHGISKEIMDKLRKSVEDGDWKHTVRVVAGKFGLKGRSVRQAFQTLYGETFDECRIRSACQSLGIDISQARKFHAKWRMLPSYGYHSDSGMAYMRIRRKMVYLGPYNSARSVERYRGELSRVISGEMRVPRKPSKNSGSWSLAVRQVRAFIVDDGGKEGIEERRRKIISLANRVAGYDQSGGGEEDLLDMVWRWSKDFHQANGRWPSLNSQCVSPENSRSWLSVERQLNSVGTSIHKLLESRGAANYRQEYTDEEISDWVTAFVARNGTWPTAKSGRIPECDKLWDTVDKYLSRRGRTLSIFVREMKSRHTSEAVAA